MGYKHEFGDRKGTISDSLHINCVTLYKYIVSLICSVFNYIIKTLGIF